MSAWCFALKATSEHHYVDVDNTIDLVTKKKDWSKSTFWIGIELYFEVFDSDGSKKESRENIVVLTRGKFDSIQMTTKSKNTKILVEKMR